MTIAQSNEYFCRLIMMTADTTKAAPYTTCEYQKTSYMDDGVLKLASKIQIYSSAVVSMLQEAWRYFLPRFLVSQN